ncbi:hypothetical protein LE181_02250 [Streptomyces sp. SCA3-4]|uniref:hypothetical protein n=1 Tax=Streptomyces sichuanensis TaxID=2871810 RepID=UPI001CE37D96|nr:hypothetical protein [Streptomyces sichuanensis]MCA6090996.1 hypothetical protein [Streptomyces sichuanensis]
MGAIIKASERIFLSLIVGAYVVSIVMITGGVVLVALGATGHTEFILFGQTFQSASVGVTAFFIGAVMAVMLIRSTLRALSSLAHAEPPFAFRGDTPAGGKRR